MADDMLKPCPFCNEPAMWRPMGDECGIPYGVVVDHKDDCWFKSVSAAFDDLPERWNTRPLMDENDALRKRVAELEGLEKFRTEALNLTKGCPGKIVVEDGFYRLKCHKTKHNRAALTERQGHD